MISLIELWCQEKFDIGQFYREILIFFVPQFYEVSEVILLIYALKLWRTSRVSNKSLN